MDGRTGGVIKPASGMEGSHPEAGVRPASARQYPDLL